MKTLIKWFFREECGAVTVDWVVITAGVVGLGMLFLTPIAFSADSSAQRVADFISSQQVTTP